MHVIYDNYTGRFSRTKVVTFPCVLLKTKHNKSPGNKETPESIGLLLKFSHRIHEMHTKRTPGFL